MDQTIRDILLQLNRAGWRTEIHGGQEFVVIVAIKTDDGRVAAVQGASRTCR